MPDTTTISTRDLTLTFGKHRGERIQRVPVNYLFWMVRNQATQHADAQVELDRRGTVVPTIQISGHAIDSASLRIRRTWHEHREKSQGLHAWLCLEAEVAYKKRVEDQDHVEHLGVKWVFDHDGEWPVLKTVMLAKGATK